MHKPVRKNYPRNNVLAIGTDEIHQLDLVDVSNISEYNNGNRFLLTCIDVFSKFAWVVPLKNKTGQTLVAAYKKVLSRGNRKPIMIHSDKGSEFTNKLFQRYLKDKNIKFYTTNSEVKASIVERFNRSLKTRMWKYFTHKNSLKYLDILQSLVKGYNRSYHRSIRMKPIEVNGETESAVWKTLYAQSEPSSKFKFELGDKVRKSKQRLTFEKSYLPGWSEEIFTVVKRSNRQFRPWYKLIDYNNEQIQGSFYEQELQKINKSDDIYRVEKVIRKRRKNGKTEYLVKWLGYPSSFNSWVTDFVR